MVSAAVGHGVYTFMAAGRPLAISGGDTVHRSQRGQRLVLAEVASAMPFFLDGPSSAAVVRRANAPYDQCIAWTLGSVGKSQQSLLLWNHGEAQSVDCSHSRFTISNGTITPMAQPNMALGVSAADQRTLEFMSASDDNVVRFTPVLTAAADSAGGSRSVRSRSICPRPRYARPTAVPCWERNYRTFTIGGHMFTPQWLWRLGEDAGSDFTIHGGSPPHQHFPSASQHICTRWHMHGLLRDYWWPCPRHVHKRSVMSLSNDGCRVACGPGRCASCVVETGPSERRTAYIGFCRHMYRNATSDLLCLDEGQARRRPTTHAHKIHAHMRQMPR